MVENKKQCYSSPNVVVQLFDDEVHMLSASTEAKDVDVSWWDFFAE